MNIFWSRKRLSEGSSNIYVCHLRVSVIHLHIFALTHSHLHILHLPIYIFKYSHLHTHTNTFSHLHKLTSSFFLSLTLTSSHLQSHIQTHTLSSSFTYIFTYWHLLFLFLALTSSHIHIFSFSPLFPLSFLSLSFLSPFSLSRLLYLLSLGRGWCRRGVMKRQPFRTKWGSMRENQGIIAILLVPDLSRRTFRTK